MALVPAHCRLGYIQEEPNPVRPHASQPIGSLGLGHFRLEIMELLLYLIPLSAALERGQILCKLILLVFDFSQIAESLFQVIKCLINVVCCYRFYHLPQAEIFWI